MSWWNDFWQVHKLSWYHHACHLPHPYFSITCLLNMICILHTKVYWQMHCFKLFLSHTVQPSKQIFLKQFLADKWGTTKNRPLLPHIQIFFWVIKLIGWLWISILENSSITKVHFVFLYVWNKLATLFKILQTRNSTDFFLLVLKYL